MARERAAASRVTVYGALLFRQNVLAAISEDHNNIHHQQHEIVVPAIRFLTPKSRVPNKDFVVYRS